MKTKPSQQLNLKKNLLVMKYSYRSIFLSFMTTVLLLFSGTLCAQRTDTFLQGTNMVLGYEPMTGDMNGDGYPDLVVENANNGYTHVYLNNGSGSFSDLGELPGMRYTESMALGDLDGDGNADLVIPYNEFSGIRSGQIWLGNGDGTFTLMPGTYIQTGGLYGFVTKIVDINQDGKNDIIYLGIGNWNIGFTSEVWLNTGTTGAPAFTLSNVFSNSTNRSSADFGDIDGDGDLDIVSGGNSWGAEIYVNNGGVFTSANYIGDYSGFTSLVDWDNDGDLDMIYYDSYNNSGLKLNRNDGNGNFESTGTVLFNWVEVGYPLNYAGQFMLVDVNNDGFKDAVIGDGNGVQGTRVLINNGCSFVMQSYVLNSGPSYGMTNADFNGDGFKDVYTGSYIFSNDLQQAIAVPLSNIASSIGASIPSGNTATLSAVASNGGSARWWDDANSGSLLGTGPSFITPVLTSGATYYVSAINSNGCESARVPVPVSIVQGTPPSISCPSDTSVIASGCSASVSFTATATGTPAPTITYSPASGSSFNVGTTTVTATATNDQGTTSCTFAVTIVDNQVPVITATGSTANNANVGCNPSSATINAALGTATATDNCIIGTPSSLDGAIVINGCSRSQTRTWNVSDNNGNAAIAVSRTISWTEDITPPTISGVGANSTITSPATPVWSTPTATDACSTPTLTSTTSSTISGTSTIYTRTWTATDACGNHSNASQTITVNGPSLPVQITCPSNIYVCYGEVVALANASSVNGEGAVVITNNAPSTFPVGITNVIWTATDSQGESSSCTQTVTRNPAIAGTISQSDISVNCQGDLKVLTVASSGGTGNHNYIWSTGASAASVTVGNGSYNVVITDTKGCANSVNSTVTISASNNLSSHVLLARKDVHLHHSTVNGGIGVTNTNGSVKIHESSVVNGFVKAAGITVNSGSVINGTRTTSASTVAMPSFRTSASTISSNTNIPNNATVTLTASNYGNINIGRGATVIFSGFSVVNVRNFTTQDNATVRFNQCTELRIREQMHIGGSNNINPTSQTVQWMVAGTNGGSGSSGGSGSASSNGQADIKSGTTFNGNIYVNCPAGVNGSGHLNIRGTNNKPTVCTGLYIAGNIHASNYVTFNSSTHCDICNFANARVGNDTQNDLAEDVTNNNPIHSIHPNPFADRTVIRFVPVTDGNLKIDIYDVSGKYIQTLFNGEVQGSKEYNVEFSGSELPAGIYIYKMITETVVYSGKMMMMKK